MMELCFELCKKIALSQTTLLQRETKRQKVAKEMLLHRAGKALPECASLLRRCKALGEGDALSSEDSLPYPTKPHSQASKHTLSSEQEGLHSAAVSSFSIHRCNSFSADVSQKFINQLYCSSMYYTVKTHEAVLEGIKRTLNYCCC